MLHAISNLLADSCEKGHVKITLGQVSHHLGESLWNCDSDVAHVLHLALELLIGGDEVIDW